MPPSKLLPHVGPDDPTLAGPVAGTAARLRSDPTPLQIPGYEILTELGRGGMGIVYKARQIRLNRIVALKMLLPFGPGEPEMLGRFRNEVETLARLNHPNIITIHDIGEHEGRPYFTMEYVDGPNLASYLQGRPQDPNAAAHLIETLARTMYVVHQHGVIHRDLKPANVLLSGEGRGARGETTSNSSLAPHHSPLATPKITDFGLAKDQAAAGRLTVTGTTMGTPCYMAPEQARSRGDGIGPATDVYALGSILYEMLTGRPPFEGESAVDVITQLVNDEPVSPTSIRPRLPADLVTVCLKCLEKSPSKRYASALDLAEDLRRFQAGEPIRARSVGVIGHVSRWCRRRPLVAGLIALSCILIVSLIGTVLFFNAQLARLAEDERRQIVQLNVNIGIIESERGDHFMAALRFTEALRLDQGHPEDEHRTRIANALARCPRLIQLRVADRRVLCAHLGDDGGWLATVGDDHSIDVADVMTGHAVGPSLRPDDSPKSCAISPDGRGLVTFSGEGPARIWNVPAGESRLLAGQEMIGMRHAVFHPDAPILFTLGPDSMVRLWDLNAQQLDLPAALSGAAVKHAALSDNARWLFTIDADNVGQLRELATGKAVAEPIHLQPEPQLAVVSADGKRIALIGSDQSLRVWDVAAKRWLGNPIRLHSATKQVLFSPDAERVLTVSAEQTSCVWHVASGTGIPLADSLRSTVQGARFDKTGRHVIALNSTGVACVWDADTGKALIPPLKGAGALHTAAFGADGKQIVTVSDRGTVSVWRLPQAGTQPPLPDARSLADLMTYTQLLTGGRLDEQQQWRKLEPDLLRAAWENLAQKKGPRVLQ